MEGLITAIKRMEIHDGDGLRTTVFFKGCPLRCIWCHNPESIGFEPQTARFRQKCIGCGTCGGEKNEQAAALCPTEALMHYGTRYTVKALADELSKDEPFFRLSGGGVTFSGGECLAQPEFAAALARELHSRGISVYIDTCGFVSRAALDGVIPWADKFLYDIKAVDPAVHKACTGQDNALILDNLRYLSQKGCRLEIRIPLVVGCNHQELSAIGQLLKDTPGVEKVKVLRYHALAASRYEALDMECTLPEPKTTQQDVTDAVALLRQFGLDAVC